MSGWRILQALFARELRLVLRGGHLMPVLAFVFICVMLMPFGLGPELSLLQRLAPGLLWVIMLMAVLLSLDRMFQADFEDGGLDQLMLLPVALEGAVMAKLCAHFVGILLPCAGDNAAGGPVAEYPPRYGGAHACDPAGRRAGIGHAGSHWCGSCSRRAARGPADCSHRYPALCAGHRVRRRCIGAVTGCTRYAGCCRPRRAGFDFRCQHFSGTARHCGCLACRITLIVGAGHYG